MQINHFNIKLNFTKQLKIKPFDASNADVRIASNSVSLISIGSAHSPYLSPRKHYKRRSTVNLAKFV